MLRPIKTTYLSAARFPKVSLYCKVYKVPEGNNARQVTKPTAKSPKLTGLFFSFKVKHIQKKSAQQKLGLIRAKTRSPERMKIPKSIFDMLM